MRIRRIFKEERKIVFLVMIVYFLGVMVGVANAETIYTVYLKDYDTGRTKVFKSAVICPADSGVYMGKDAECTFPVKNWRLFIPYTSISHISRDAGTTEGSYILKPLKP